MHNNKKNKIKQNKVINQVQKGSIDSQGIFHIHSQA